MGVAGLWDLIQHTSETRSLTHLAVVDGFEKNSSGLRGYRIGIDASIWFFHAKSGREGENPELRLIFFRLAKLLSEPFLPLFVFDGPKRPSWKRGIQISKKPHWMVHGVKVMINAFGFEWRQAPGEAEAELAYLNRVGVIDGVLSDDVDNFLFGALTVIRNPGRGLTGNIGNPAVNLEGKDDGNHVRIFSLPTIAADKSAGLNRAGFILIGLLSGGDYEEKDLPGSKLMGCGITTAHALARCGFGEELVNAFNVLPADEFQDYLSEWRDAMRQELRTNSRGYLSRKQAKLADALPDAFPNLKVLRSYIQPITTESEALASGKPAKVPEITWSHEHSLATLARFCEEKFEWGTMAIIPKRFRSLLWHGSVIRILRRAMLDLDRGDHASWKSGHVISTERPMGQGVNSIACPPQTPTKNRILGGARGGAEIGTPSKMITKYFATVSLESPKKTARDDADTDDEHVLISKISASTTKHPQTDYMLEYRVELDPYQLIHLTQSGIEGVRDEPADDSGGSEAGDAGDDDDEDGPAVGKKKRKGKVVDPFSLHRIWVPASMLRAVEKDLVEVFEEAEEAKRAKKAGKGGAKRPLKERSATAPTRKQVSSTANVRPKPTKARSAPSAVSKGKASSGDEEGEKFDLNAVSDASLDSDDDGNTNQLKPSGSRAPSASSKYSTSSKTSALEPKSRSLLKVLEDTEEDIFAIPSPPRASSTKSLVPTIKSTGAPGKRVLGGKSAKATSAPISRASSARPAVVKQPSTVPASRARSEVDNSDWDDLFPTAPKVPISADFLPPPTRKTTSTKPLPAATSILPKLSSPTKRRHVITDSEEDLPPARSPANSPAPKSPRKSKAQSSPHRKTSKAGSSKSSTASTSTTTALLRRMGLPSLSSGSDSDSDSDTRNGMEASRRSTSPTPRKGSSAPLRSTTQRAGAQSQASSKTSKVATGEVVDLSSDDSSDDLGSDRQPVKPLQLALTSNGKLSTSLTTTAKSTSSSHGIGTGKLGTTALAKGEGASSKTAKNGSQPGLPLRAVKASQTSAARSEVNKPAAARPKAPTAILDVIDLTTP